MMLPSNALSRDKISKDYNNFFFRFLPKFHQCGYRYTRFVQASHHFHFCS